MSNPRCFFDISLEGKLLGRVIFELFADAVPKTAENFRALCTGSAGVNEMGIPLYYKGTPFHRIIAGFMVQGGDFTLRNGKGGQSIYGATFEDEDLRREIDSEGLLVMANRGKNTNGSQFFVSLRPCPHLLGKHVVFGRVVKGYEVIEAISKLPVNEKDHPLQLVTISHCGQLERKGKAHQKFPISARDRLLSLANPDSLRSSGQESANTNTFPFPHFRSFKITLTFPLRLSLAFSFPRTQEEKPVPISLPFASEQIEALKAQALKEEEDERMKKEARLTELKELKMRVEREGQRGQTRRVDGRGMGDWRDEPVGNGEGSRNGGVLYKGRGKMSAPSEGSRRSTGMLGWDD
ncbi:BQ5605_C009g05705 [Microbotryum silenes-dioicae]|uniref:peptidylprolyl isomerase n=1 Tax=Microbotryum silenes-dioicae TaxID=796604 RepID=A0A2X0P9B1_9BASI|nr:BQ5605_C009g05705 [Microbotryum silenes-dioicae]